MEKDVETIEAEVSETEGQIFPARILIDKFVARAHRITVADCDLLHQLTVGVFWPHRAGDIEMMVKLGDGYLAVDEIGRPLASALAYKSGADFAMLGMMATAPRLQSQGAGRWLMRQVMRDCAGRDMRMNATRAGYRLYESEGFLPLGLVWQHQGIAKPIHDPDPVPGVTLRPMTQADLPSIRALDLIAFGTDRTRTLDATLALSEGVVAERGGEICAFALAREFGRGIVIGPIVTDEDSIAMLLTAHFIRKHVGTFLRVDTPVNSDKFRSFLAAAGLGNYDTVTEMYIGKQLRPFSGIQIYGLIAHSLG